jgi:hypothetical protein
MFILIAVGEPPMSIPLIDVSAIDIGLGFSGVVVSWPFVIFLLDGILLCLVSISILPILCCAAAVIYPYSKTTIKYDRFIGTIVLV